MVLRPAEVAILILICVTYGLEPFRHQIGFDCMEETYQEYLKNIIATAVLCKLDFFFKFNENELRLSVIIFSERILFIISHRNIHKFTQCKIVRYDQQYLQHWKSYCMCDCYCGWSI